MSKRPDLKQKLFQATLRKKLEEMGVEEIKEPSEFELVEQIFRIESQVKDLVGENNNDLSWQSLLKAATEACLELVKEDNWRQSLSGLIRTNSGKQQTNEGPSQGSPVPAGGGVEGAATPNPVAGLNLEDSASVSMGEDIDYLDEERLI